MSTNRRGVALLGAALILLADTGHAGTNSWTIEGPPGGAFREVQASSTASNVFYATYSRSVHRSIDGGSSWTTVRDFASQVNGLAVDPGNGERLYVSVIDHGLFRSEDSGQTFTQVAPAGAGVWGVGTNASTVYYSSPNRIYRSMDRGQSWTAFTIENQTLNKIIVDPQNGNVAYGFNGAYLYRSSDGGANWLKTTLNSSVPDSSAPTIHDLAQLSTKQFIAVTADGLLTSSDSGATWTLTAAGAFDSVTADASTPGRAVATHRGSAPLQITTDYGATWATFGNIPALRPEGVSFSANAPGRMVALGQQGALVTNDSAHTWSEATQHPIASGPTHFATTLAGNSKVYTFTIGGGSGLFATSGDAGWQRLNLAAAQALSPGTEFTEARVAVKPGSPDSIFFGAFNQGVYRSVDGGQSWSAPNFELNGFAPRAFAFDPNDANTMYVSVHRVAATPAAGIYRSTDGGVTWSPHSTNLSPNLFGTDLQIDPTDPTRMFLGVDQIFAPDSGGLYRSSDRGSTWTQYFIGQDVGSVAIDPENPSRIYVAAANGLYLSDDGGESFRANSPFASIANNSARAVAIDPVVPSTIYVASLDTRSPFGVRASSWILRSVDRGQSWEVLRDGSTTDASWYVQQLALDPNKPALVYAGTTVRGAATFEVAPDLRVEISDHSGTRPKGHESTFHLRTVNNGPFAATRVNLSAALPAGLTNVSITASQGTCSTSSCTIPVLRVGEEVTAVVSYTTPDAAMLIPVTATVSAHESDAAADDNSAQASAIAGDPGDLSIVVTPSTTSVAQGGSVTYTVTVTNRGANSSTEGTVNFNLGSSFTLGTLPSGCNASSGGASCNLGALAPGASQSFTFSAAATIAGSVEATANVAFGTAMADIHPEDNSATSSVTATTPPPTANGGMGSAGRRGSGGGSMNLATLLGGLLLLLYRRRLH